MKKLLFILILFCFSNKSYCQTNFNGLWGWVNETSGFSLKLNQINNVITGYHCATSNNGMFIDSGLNSISVSGTVQGDSAIVTFISGYSGEHGSAVIKRIDATHIHWIITKEPEGVSYIPENVFMESDSSSTASPASSPTTGSFTFFPDFWGITSSITNDGAYVSFYIAFFPNFKMENGVDYLVANISANCRPSTRQIIEYNGEKTWNITIEPNGDVYFKIICCDTVLDGVGFENITYPFPSN